MEGTHGQNSFTEAEAIQITMDNGYDGSEYKTSLWQQRGCLKLNGTYQALIEKLKTIYNHVEVTGSGKKRTYILSDKKNEVSIREFKYRGSIPTPEDEIMKEYIFNKLLTYPNNFNKSYKGWANLIGFIDTSILSFEEMTEIIKSIHKKFPVIYNSKEVVSMFVQTLNIRNKDIIEKSFLRLQKEDRIKVTENYNVKYCDDTYAKITQLEYDEIINYIKEFLESKEVTYYTYSQALNSLHKSRKMKEVINEVDCYLEEYFGIRYIFKSFQVAILDRTIKREIKYTEFNTSFYNRLIHLTKNRQKKYNASLSFWKRFYLINTIALLNYIGVTGVDIILKEQRKQYLEMSDNLIIDRMNYYFESDQQKENKRHTFGNN